MFAGVRKVCKNRLLSTERIAKRIVAAECLHHGDSLAEASERSGLQPRDALKWYHRLKTNKNCKDAPRSGRPKLLTKADEEIILKVSSWLKSIRVL